MHADKARGLNPEDLGLSTLSTLSTVLIPGHGRFYVTDSALEMVRVFGGVRHCYLGNGGCRKQGLYFSPASVQPGSRPANGPPVSMMPGSA